MSDPRTSSGFASTPFVLAAEASNTKLYHRTKKTKSRPTGGAFLLAHAVTSPRGSAPRRPAILTNGSSALPPWSAGFTAVSSDGVARAAPVI